MIEEILRQQRPIFFGLKLLASPRYECPRAATQEAPRLASRQGRGCPQGIIDLPESIRRPPATLLRDSPTRFSAPKLPPARQNSHQRAALSQETASYGGGVAKQKPRAQASERG